jgi:hypothetical protein
MNWAEKEIELACKHENPDWDGESFDYGCGPNYWCARNRIISIPF